MACPSDALLARLVDGGLEPHELRALEEHIDGCAACRELVAALARDPESDTMRAWSGSRLPVLAGPVFEGNERFDVLRLLGAGGMGVVYEVFDHRRDEVVALKTLPEVDPEGFLRLKDEFRALADVRHANLVRLHDLVLGEDRCFFTMERVPGLPLDRALAPLPARDGERLRALFVQLVEAVRELHRRGLLHRDLKPGNVLVTPDDRVVVLDFGLAIEWRPGAVARARVIAGTSSYMAPEQVRRETLGPATDWYAVGGCLYRCLSGEPPFVGDSPTELLALKSREAPKPRPLPHPDRALVDLCLRLLEPEPSARPDADAILRALGAEPSAIPRELRLVGRQSELSSVAQSIAGRRPRLIVGAPGVGKTALVLEALRRERRATPASLVLTSRCRPQEYVPFNALDGIVDGIARHLRESPDPKPASPLVSLAALFPSLRPFAPARTELSESASPAYVRHRAYDELGRLLSELGERHRLLLFIDDLQWADADSVELLTHLLDAPGGWSILGTARTDALGESLAPEPLADRMVPLRLAPLSDDSSRRLLEALGVTDDIENLLVTADGQPLWLQRLARSDSGHRGSLGHLLTHQIRALGAPARRLLELVTLAGTPLRLEVLAEASGMGQGAARRCCEQLQAELLVRIEPPAEAPRIEPYHDRVRELCSPPSAERAADRLALARALARGIEHRAELFACADHANSAFDLATAEDARAFAGINARAAEQARDATAYESCALYARAGRRWLDAAGVAGSPEARRSLELLEIEALYLGGRREEALEVFRNAIRDRAPVDQIEHWQRRIRLELVIGDPRRALEAGREALARLGAPLPDDVSSPRLLRTLARTEIGTLGRWERLLRTERACPPIVLAEMRLLAALAPVALFLGDVRLMVLLAVRCLERSLRHGLAPESLLGIVGHGGAAAVTRRYGRARATFDLARRTEARFPRVPPIAYLGMAGWVAPWAEPLPETARRLRAAEAELEARGDAYGGTLTRGLRLIAAWQSGAPLPELEEIARGALERIEEANLGFEELASMLSLSRSTLARIRHGADLPAKPTHRNPFGTFFTHLHEALVRHHWGEVEPALRAIRRARRHRSAALGQSLLGQLHSYLVLLGCEAAEAGIESGPRAGLRAVEDLVELRAMSRACPANYAYQWHLAWAEAQRWRGARFASVQQAYERAIDTARESRNLEYEGIARQRRLGHLARSGRRVDPREVRRMERVFADWGSPKRGRQLAEAFEGSA